MGRYDFSPQRVHSYATQLLQNKRISVPPPWYNVIASIPPSERLTRPPLQRSQRPGKKPSKLFKPLRLQYGEDRLRWEYFNDHPWELARPKVILEDDGRDHEKWDWSVPLDHALQRPTPGMRDQEGVDLNAEWDRVRAEQCGRPINGEAVVQRQAYLMSVGHGVNAAYDIARKEFYRVRHANEVEARVAREEALSTGAFFGPGPNEVGEKLEDMAYEDWRQWAVKENSNLKQIQGAAYSGDEVEESAVSEIQQSEVAETDVAENSSARQGA